jgi:hypothetical protein
MFIVKRKRVVASRNNHQPLDVSVASLLPKKSVTFHTSVHIFPTLHIRDYTLQQKTDTWYSWEETQYFKLNIYDELNNMIPSLPCHADHSSSTTTTTTTTTTTPISVGMFGLEYFTRSGKDRRRQRRRYAIDSVLLLQGLQIFRIGYRDDVSLANEYAHNSVESQQVARRRGMADEHYVLSCHHE